MATIEPSWMHLLNDSNATHSPPLELPHSLPPIQNFALANPGHTLSLPPLDLDNGPRPEKSTSQAPLAPKPIPPLYSLANEDNAHRQGLLAESGHNEDGSSRIKKTAHSLRLLLDDPETTSSLRMILDDTSEILEDPSTKKRHRALAPKDDLIQLPQPLKKQKSSQQVIPLQQVVPPIINGLHEPPPNAAVFPPISSAEFDDNEALNLTSLKEFGLALHTNAADGDKISAAKSKRRAAKPRRKWLEEETNHLLLGVSRHGVGKWTNILEDPDYQFNDRTAGDLKDRFRTCCPDELRGKLGNKDGVLDKPPSGVSESRLKSKTSLTLENILIDSDEPDRDRPMPPSYQDLDSAPKQRKSRAHRKKMEDLVELGIHGPFKKSHRRERRHFTEQDDKEILEGLDKYGPAWTKIQRDSQFNLSSRQPTDLRDRVRNKYPDIYARIEKGNSEAKETGRGGGLLEPSVHTTMENSLKSTKSGPLEPSLNRSNSKEDMPKWPPPSNLLDIGDPQAFDLNDSSATVLLGNVGEMDISRLLLDDSQLSTDP